MGVNDSFSCCLIKMYGLWSLLTLEISEMMNTYGPLAAARPGSKLVNWFLCEARIRNAPTKMGDGRWAMCGTGSRPKYCNPFIRLSVLTFFCFLDEMASHARSNGTDAKVAFLY